MLPLFGCKGRALTVSARRAGSLMGPPVGSRPPGRRLDGSRHGVSEYPLTDEHDTRRAHWSDDTASRTDHIFGIVTTIARMTGCGLPRESRDTVAPRPLLGQGERSRSAPLFRRLCRRSSFRTFILTDDAVLMQAGRTFVGQRMLPFCPMAIDPGCGQYVRPCGLAPVAMMVMSSPLVVSITDTDP